MKQYKRRTDSNQKEIIKALTERYGKGAVVPLSTVGEGVPDLLVGVSDERSGRRHNILLEVKTDSGALTPTQVKWHSAWQGQAAIVRTIDDAIQAIEAYIMDDNGNR